MYGLIGKIIAVERKREELADILLSSISELPGCLSYIVATDPNDENALWITEVWQNQQSHRDSLALESVQQAIRLGKPLIASFAERHETTPLSGNNF